MIANLWDNAQRARVATAEAAFAKSDSVQGALNAIIALIPTEIIGMYIALGGLFGQGWWLFWTGCALIPLLLVITHVERTRAAGSATPAPSIGQLAAAMVFAFIAFVPWTATLPETPFLSFSPDATKIGAGAAIVISVFLPRLARLFGVGN